MSDHLQAGLLRGCPHAFSTMRELDLAAILPGAELIRVKQVHGNTVVESELASEALVKADGIVTNRSGVLLGIVTADCAPVLFADPVAGVIGAAHAGWRGALGGILENTVAAMIALGALAENICAAIGPTISQASYEVDEAFEERFAEQDSCFFEPGREGHRQFDLPAYVADRIRRAGVSRVEDLGEDTYAQPDRFYSYRRATHRGETTEGRQLSVIGLRDRG